MAFSGGVSLIGRFLGNAVSEATAFAAGVALGPVLGPPVQEIRNTVNSQYPFVPVDPGTAAGIAAEDVESLDWARQEALYHGIDQARFDAIHGAQLNAPGPPDLLTMLRRKLIDGGDFTHGLRKARQEGRWDAAWQGLAQVLLSPSDLANARQQGFVDEARQHEEAGLQGVDAERADIQFELSGLPPGVDVLQRAANRKLIDQATFTQGVREGHTKTKYTDLLWQMRNPLLSAATYVRLYLKGWITEAAMNAGGALWGYTPEQMHQWYLSEGRPATVHQVHIGYARGAKLPGAANEQEAIGMAVKQSDIRPEYEDLLYASRYTLPSAFVLRGLVTAGSLTAAEGEQVLIQSGWPPDLAAKVGASWGAATAGPTADPHVTKAEVQLWTTLHKSYVARKTGDTLARQTLAQAGVQAAAIDQVLQLWGHERELVRKELTPAQIKKAVDEPYATTAEKLAALEDLGYSETDAQTFLAE